MDLPPELLSIICSFLAKVDLKAFRQVCHLFNQAAVPFLFDRVYISASKEDLEVSILIGQRFGLYVKGLVFIARYYEEHCRIYYDEKITAYLARHGIDDVTDQELATSCAEYCAKREEHNELISNREDVVHLCYAFARMPNIEKVCI